MPEDETLEKALSALGCQVGANGTVDIGAAYRVAHQAAACELRTDDFLRERAAVIKAAGKSGVAFEWLGRLLAVDGLAPSERCFLTRVQGLLFD